MRLVAKIDERGSFLEDVLLEDSEETPEGCIEERPPEGLHAPKWVGSEWAEGKPQAEIVEALKPRKLSEIHAAALDELAPLFTDEHGKDELIFLLAAHVRRILGAQADPRLGTVEEVGKKALAKRDEVERAQSLEELEAVEWT